MSTLHQIDLHFNPQLSLSNNGGQLSSDAGLLLVQEFLNRIDFDSLVQEHSPFFDPRKYCQHTPVDLFKQLLFQTIAGYKADSASDCLRNDPIFTLALSKERLASQPTISRFVKHWDHQTVSGLQSLNFQLGERFVHQMNRQEMVIDLDSTHSDTFGYQENAAYNGHYQTTGYHPLLAFDGLTGLFLDAQLRPGNVYTSNGAAQFLRPILERYRGSSCERRCLVRGDSGFATPAIYHLCDELQATFLIRLKSTAKLQRFGEERVLYSDDTDFTKQEVQWQSLDYQASTWQRPYRVIIKSTRKAGEYLFHHEFLVTNLEDLFPAAVFPMYQHRGVMENDIKEIKYGFFFDKTDYTGFAQNATRMMLSGIAYNIVQMMKHFTFPKKDQKATVSTIRFKLFHIAAKVTTHARKICVQLSSTNVFDRLFWQVLHRIQTFQLY